MGDEVPEFSAAAPWPQSAGGKHAHTNTVKGCDRRGHRLVSTADSP
jgi:hypothetical protein